MVGRMVMAGSVREVTEAPHEGPSDEALVASYARARDAEALETLIRRHWPRAVRIARKILQDPVAAEDAAQDAFVKLCGAASGFKAGAAFEPWFYRIALNAAKDAARSARRRLRHEAAALERSAGPAGSDESAERERLTAAVDAHLAQLPVDLRFALVLRFYEGKPHTEVAAALGCPEGTASSKIRRGLEKLRASLAGAGIVAAEVAITAALAPGKAEAMSIPGRPTASRIAGEARRMGLRTLLAKALATVAAGLLVGGLSAGYYVRGGSEKVVASVPSALEVRDASPGPAAPPRVVASVPAAPQGAPVPGEGSSAGDASAAKARSAATPEPRVAAGAGKARRHAPATPEELADLIHPELGRVRGRVLRAEDGAPIAGAFVYAHTPYHGMSTDSVRGADSVRTGADGGFEIAFKGNIAMGLFSAGTFPALALEVVAEGCAPGLRPVARESLSKDAAPVEIRLERGGFRLEGTLVDKRTDAPLAGRIVHLKQPLPPVTKESMSADHPCTTDAGGRFAFEGLRRGAATLSFRTTEESSGAECAMLAVVIGPDTAPVRFAVAEPATVVVSLVDSDGDLIEGQGEIGERSQGFSGVGPVTVEGLAAEGVGVAAVGGHDKSIALSRLNAGLVDAEVKDLHLEPGERREVRLTVDRSSYGSLSGRVAGPDGAPLAGAVVAICAAEDVVLSGGAFQYRTFDDPGHDELASSMNGLAQALGGAVGGLLGAGPTEARKPAPSPFRPTQTTDEDGRFEIRLVPPGLYSIRARKKGLATVEEKVEVAARQAAGKDLRLGPADETKMPSHTHGLRAENGQLSLGDDTAPDGKEKVALVVRGNLRPPPGESLPASVNVHFDEPGDRHLSHPARPEPDGSFEARFDLAPDARGNLVLDFDDYVTRDCGPLAASSSPVDVGIIELDRGLTLRGRIIEKGGAPAVLVCVHAQLDHGPGFAEPDADGHFILPKLPGAPFKLTIIRIRRNVSHLGGMARMEFETPVLERDVDPRAVTDLGDIVVPEASAKTEAPGE